VQVRIFLTQTDVTNSFLITENNIKWKREIHRPQRSELRCTMPEYKRFKKCNSHRHSDYTYLCHTTQFTSLCSIHRHTMHQWYQMLYCPTNALKYIKLLNC
jgi:hypothetical protein